MGDEDGEPWKARAVTAGRAVLERRVELGWRTRGEFAKRTGLTIKTLGEIERGVRSHYSDTTYLTIDQVLKWPPGTLETLLTTRGGLGRGLGALIPTPGPRGMSKLEIARYLWPNAMPLVDLLGDCGLNEAQVFELTRQAQELQRKQMGDLMAEMAARIRALGGDAPTGGDDT